MDCKTANMVWNHTDLLKLPTDKQPTAFVAALKEKLPGVFEELDRLVSNFKAKKSEFFNDAVHKKEPGNYYVEHAAEGSHLAEQVHDVVGDEVGSQLLEKYFSQKHGTPIKLSNICCGSCAISDSSLSFEKMLSVQMAAVNTEH